MNQSGDIFYKDQYDQLYRTTWSTVGDVIDLTTIIQQPYVWGEPPAGRIENHVLFRRGIITVTRQVIRPFPGGYEIVAEGTSSYIDFIQMNFPCQVGPTDQFKYHLNHGMTDSCETLMTDGPRWADPDSSDDDDIIWSELDGSGAAITTITNDIELFAFIDAWGL